MRDDRPVQSAGGPGVRIRLRGDGATKADDIWLARSSRVLLEGVTTGRHYDLTIQLESGGDELYTYFPFNAWLRPHGALGEIIEVSAPHQRHVVHIPAVLARADAIQLDFTSDLGTVPAKVGLGSDVRELAIRLISVEGRIDAAQEMPTVRRSNMWMGSGTRPIFVIGAYRSGTSITTWAIGQHPNICALDETGWVHSSLVALKACFALANDRTDSAAEIYDVNELDFLSAFTSSLDCLHHKINRMRSQDVAFTRLAGKAHHFRSEVQIQRSPRAPKARWVDGTPENSTAGRLIADAFPGSQFVVMVRHPLEVVRSLAFFERAGGRNYRPEEALSTWSRLTALAIDTARYVGPERAVVVTYDKLSDPKTLMRECLAFLGEPYFEPSAVAYGLRLNTSHASNESLTVDDSPALNGAVALYEMIRSGRLPEISAFGVPGLESYDDFMNGWCVRVREAFSASHQPTMP